MSELSGTAPVALVLPLVLGLLLGPPGGCAVAKFRARN
nr:putative membrane protein [Rhodococcus sp. JVH1]